MPCGFWIVWKPQAPLFTKHSPANVAPPAEETQSTRGGGLLLIAIIALILIGRHLRKVSGGAQTRRVRQALTQLQTAQA